jgi:TonB family protein
MHKTFHIVGGMVLMTFLFVLPLVARDANVTYDNEPAVVAAVAPEFPPIARSAHAQGEVVVEITLAPDGTVETSKSLSGHPLLQRAAEIAAKKWKFALADNRPHRLRLNFGFGYADGKKSDPQFIITFMPPYKVEVMLNLSRVPVIEENSAQETYEKG